MSLRTKLKFGCLIIIGVGFFFLPAKSFAFNVVTGDVVYSGGQITFNGFFTLKENESADDITKLLFRYRKQGSADFTPVDIPLPLTEAIKQSKTFNHTLALEPGDYEYQARGTIDPKGDPPPYTVPGSTILKKFSVTKSTGKCEVFGAEFDQAGTALWDKYDDENKPDVTLTINFSQECVNRNSVRVFIFGNYAESEEDPGAEENIDILEKFSFTPILPVVKLRFKAGDEEGADSFALYWARIEARVAEDNWQIQYDSFRNGLTKEFTVDGETKSFVNLDELDDEVEKTKVKPVLDQTIGNRQDWLGYLCDGGCTSDWEWDPKGNEGTGAVAGAPTECEVLSASFNPGGEGKLQDYHDIPDFPVRLTINFQADTCKGQQIRLSVVGGEPGVLAPVENIDLIRINITGNPLIIDLVAGEDNCNADETCKYGIAIYSAEGTVALVDAIFHSVGPFQGEPEIGYKCAVTPTANETTDNPCVNTGDQGKTFGWKMTGTIIGGQFVTDTGQISTSGAAPSLEYTGEYKFLEPLPGFGTSIDVKTKVGDYVNRIITLIIMIAGVLAVLMLVIGGIKWMLEESVIEKGEAKKMIGNALFGLVLILASYMILNTINPNLVNVSLAVRSVTLGTEDVAQVAIDGKFCTGISGWTVSQGDKWKDINTNKGISLATLADYKGVKLQTNKGECENVGDSCTSLYGFKSDYIHEIIDKCQNCQDKKITITVTGGTECWAHGYDAVKKKQVFTYHYPGSGLGIDLGTEEVLNNFLEKNKDKLSFEVIDERRSKNHWHLEPKSK